MPESKSSQNHPTSGHRRGNTSMSRSKRSEAAKRGWVTRRKNAAKRS